MRLELPHTLAILISETVTKDWRDCWFYRSFGDSDFRNKLLVTGEIAGSTVRGWNTNHYLLANMALVGEAITLAMRTSVPWHNETNENK